MARTVRAKDDKSKAQRLVRDFEESDGSLKEFIADNENLMEIYFTLVENRNIALVEAQDAVRAVEGKEHLRFGPFSRNKQAKSKVLYNPQFLPKEVLSMPGVVKEVDAAKIRDYLEDGRIDYEQIADARYEKEPNKPTLKAPKLITTGG